jgi:hypothetical protein
MVVAVAVGVVIVLALAVVAAVRYLRRPELTPLAPETVALAPESSGSQIRILRDPDELNAAIERASNTEQTLAAMASKRAARYSRFSGSEVTRVDDDVRPRSSVRRLRIDETSSDPQPPQTAEPGM